MKGVLSQNWCIVVMCIFCDIYLFEYKNNYKVEVPNRINSVQKEQ